MNSRSPEEILKKYFGYDNFRPFQKDVINNILGGKDALIVMPTGGGKSLIYQIPSLILDGLTVVISPLIALMKDQVDALQANGIEAAYINSSLTELERREVYSNLTNGKIKLLYISPEKLLSNGFIDYLKDLSVEFFAIDEAHCISAWGHDFRPEYSRLSNLKNHFPEKPIVALTATADKVTQNDICTQLGITAENKFIASFDRPNLSLNVLPAKNRYQFISKHINNRANQAGIIYCLSRKSTESLAEKLQNEGVKAASYHAGMSTKKRNKVQEDFINDKLTVICATIAFGMGIDKSNIRWVIHYNMPKNVESYYQEIGRAGRDGLKSDTYLFYNFGDIITLQQFAKESGQPEIQLAKLDRIKEYAESPTCRRKILLNYFNEHKEDDCGNCDVCSDPPETFDGTRIAQKALSASYRTNEKLSTGILIDVLRGSGKKEIYDNGYNNIKTYGAGRELTYFEWQQNLMQMIHQGIMEIAYDDNQTLKITEAGRKVLFENKKVNLVHRTFIEKFQETKEKKAKKKTKKERLKDDLFEILRKLRKNISEGMNVPAYVIFSDRTLEELAFSRPVNYEEMIDIYGISEYKYQKYGEAFINEIKKFKISEKDKGSTYLATLQLLNEGFSIEEISRQRNIKPLTVFSHLAQLYITGEKIDILKFVTKDEVNKISEVVKTKGYSMPLKELYEEFEGKIDYPQLRLGIAYCVKNNS